MSTHLITFPLPSSLCSGSLVHSSQYRQTCVVDLLRPPCTRCPLYIPPPDTSWQGNNVTCHKDTTTVWCKTYPWIYLLQDLGFNTYIECLYCINWNPNLNLSPNLAPIDPPTFDCNLFWYQLKGQSDIFDCSTWWYSYFMVSSMSCLPIAHWNCRPHVLIAMGIHVSWNSCELRGCNTLLTWVIAVCNGQQDQKP